MLWMGGLVAATLTLSTWVGAQAPQAPAPVRTVLLRQDLSTAGQEAVLVRVEIPVGGREGRHTHPGTAMIHVLEGALTLDYDGKPTVTYKAGESFSVEPNKIHEGINRGNAPVKAIATFIVEKGKALTTQVK
jgi:quercetin dioxygenase-like cupin family protein